MLKKLVAILLAFASIDLGLSFDKYTTEILNGEFLNRIIIILYALTKNVGNPHNMAII